MGCQCFRGSELSSALGSKKRSDPAICTCSTLRKKPPRHAKIRAFRKNTAFWWLLEFYDFLSWMSIFGRNSDFRKTNDYLIKKIGTTYTMVVRRLWYHFVFVVNLSIVAIEKWSLNCRAMPSLRVSNSACCVLNVLAIKHLVPKGMWALIALMCKNGFST